MRNSKKYKTLSSLLNVIKTSSFLQFSDYADVRNLSTLYTRRVHEQQNAQMAVPFSTVLFEKSSNT